MNGYIVQALTIHKGTVAIGIGHQAPCLDVRIGFGDDNLCIRHHRSRCIFDNAAQHGAVGLR